MVSARLEDLADTDIADYITQTDGNGKNSRHIPLQDGLGPTKKARKHLNKSYESDIFLDKAKSSSLVNSIHAICCFGGVAADNSIVDDKSDKEEICIDDGDRESWLLPPPLPQDSGKKCLVLDLDETLVHSTFKAVPWADFAIPVKIGGKTHFVYVTKRPGVDDFLRNMAKHYEIIVYTASREKYADPLLDILDQDNVIRTRLYRESCVFFDGFYIKDLSRLNRDLSQTIIVDNSPNSYIFHPENAIDCSSFIDDPFDKELYCIASFLQEISQVSDVRHSCAGWTQWKSNFKFSNVET